MMTISRIVFSVLLLVSHLAIDLLDLPLCRPPMWSLEEGRPAWLSPRGVRLSVLVISATVNSVITHEPWWT
ncbi:hypothetical protein B0H13DRAFT_2390607 [Mycena leptocephala]|nr:hypothetical protein B0H13DRAFT_2390607 [Mycena leptocephala]